MLNIMTITLQLLRQISKDTQKENVSKTTNTYKERKKEANSLTRKRFLNVMINLTQKSVKHELSPVLLVEQDILRYVRLLLKDKLCHIFVISFAEVSPQVRVNPIVSIEL